MSHFTLSRLHMYKNHLSNLTISLILRGQQQNRRCFVYGKDMTCFLYPTQISQELIFLTNVEWFSHLGWVISFKWVILNISLCNIIISKTLSDTSSSLNSPPSSPFCALWEWNIKEIIETNLFNDDRAFHQSHRENHRY